MRERDSVYGRKKGQKKSEGKVEVFLLEPTCFIVRIDLAKHVFYAIACSSLLFTFCGQKVTKTSGSTYVFGVRSRFCVSLMVVSQSINFGRHDHASAVRD